MKNKPIWVLTTPDNETYSPEIAEEVISSLASRFDVEVTPTGETRDGGHGQEEKFLLCGKQNDIALFEETLEDELK